MITCEEGCSERGLGKSNRISLRTFNRSKTSWLKDCHNKQSKTTTCLTCLYRRRHPLIFIMVCWGPQDHTRFQRFPGKINTTLKSCYSHGFALLSIRIQIKISKGKWCVGKSPGESKCKLHLSSPSRIVQGVLHSPSPNVGLHM